VNIALWVTIVLLILVFVKNVVLGKSLWDRLLGMSVISTKVIVLIMLFASMRETAYLLDFAIVYALFGFIGTIFIALFMAKREKKG